MILAGDVGGTKTHIALFDVSKGTKIVREQKYQSREFESLSHIVHLFLAEEKLEIESACFGIAGPVEEGVCRATNLPWVVDNRELSKDLKIPKVWLINDLEANAYGISSLQSSELYVLNKGKARPGNGALIAAGTGLGEAGIFWDGKKHTPFATEGGHADFAPRDGLELELWRYLHARFDHVSYERVLSGPGIYNLYRFLIDTDREKEIEEVKNRFLNEDPPLVITDSALKRRCQACLRTVTWFTSLYGGATGNLALKFLSLNGIYVGGGIAPKILDFLKEGSFMGAFCAKGRFAPLLASIPVKIVLNENTALLGAFNYARSNG